MPLPPAQVLVNIENTELFLAKAIKKANIAKKFTIHP